MVVATDQINLSLTVRYLFVVPLPLCLGWLHSCARCYKIPLERTNNRHNGSWKIR